MLHAWLHPDEWRALERGDPLTFHFVDCTSPFGLDETVSLHRKEGEGALEAKVILIAPTERGVDVAVSAAEVMTLHQQVVLQALWNLGLIFKADRRTLLSVCARLGLNPESDGDLDRVVPMEIQALVDELKKLEEGQKDG